MVVAIAESRVSHADGVKNAVLSVLERAPGQLVHVFVPSSAHDLRGWLGACPGVTVRTIDGFPDGFNIKPSILLSLLEEGHPEVVWVDSDVIVVSDWRGLLDPVDEGTFVATEEFPWGQGQGGTHRATAWGFTAVRSLPRTVNSGFMRCSPAHTGLLTAWRGLLTDERYLAAQRAPWQQRPLHLFGDQEVLTALLSAEAFSGLPLHLLAQGRDIAQCFGASGWGPRDRIAALAHARPPVLVHAMGPKPYGPAAPAENTTGQARLRAGYTRVRNRIAPYPILARAYRQWRVVPPTPGALAARAGRPVPLVRMSLAEFPLAAAEDGAKRLRRRRGIGRLVIKDTAEV